jgi:hypothetical protein
MRKTIALLLGAAFIATIPTAASAKKMKRVKPQRVAVQQTDPNAATGHFLGAALHQIVVPLEVTFGTRR